MWNGILSRIHAGFINAQTHHPGAAQSFALNPDVLKGIEMSLRPAPTGDPREVLTLFGLTVTPDEKVPRNIARVMGAHGVVLEDVLLRGSVAILMDRERIDDEMAKLWEPATALARLVSNPQLDDERWLTELSEVLASIREHDKNLRHVLGLFG